MIKNGMLVAFVRTTNKWKAQDWGTLRKVVKTALDTYGRWAHGIMDGWTNEGIGEGRRTRKRPRQMIPNWMATDGCGKLTEEVQQLEEWRRRTLQPA